ncbi:hypothetical protein TNCV_3330791 [Trichonephila clavipes]|nr:hypothetical protein TNCV_3330791 [Trichonephila clavipes]
MPKPSSRLTHYIRYKQRHLVTLKSSSTLTVRQNPLHMFFIEIDHVGYESGDSYTLPLRSAGTYNSQDTIVNKIEITLFLGRPGTGSWLGITALRYWRCLVRSGDGWKRLVQKDWF